MLELTLADLTSISNAADKAARKVRIGDKTAAAEAELLGRAKAVLDEGRTLRSQDWTEEELTVFRNLAPLTLKPAVVVLNTDDEGASGAAGTAADLAKTVHPDAEGISIPARLEEEVSGLEAADAAELLEGYGVTTRALPTVIASAYRMLGLLTFLTAGEDESRAWEVRRGA
jgi:ribosome-binding ATPase YchF (GTP1/OBG family)